MRGVLEERLGDEQVAGAESNDRELARRRTLKSRDDDNMPMLQCSELADWLCTCELVCKAWLAATREHMAATWRKLCTDEFPWEHVPPRAKSIVVGARHSSMSRVTFGRRSTTRTASETEIIGSSWSSARLVVSHGTHLCRETVTDERRRRHSGCERLATTLSGRRSAEADSHSPVLVPKALRAAQRGQRSGDGEGRDCSPPAPRTAMVL